MRRYGALGERIRAHGAGWTIDPTDVDGLVDPGRAPRRQPRRGAAGHPSGARHRARHRGGHRASLRRARTSAQTSGGPPRERRRRPGPAPPPAAGHGRGQRAPAGAARRPPRDRRCATSWPIRHHGPARLRSAARRAEIARGLDPYARSPTPPEHRAEDPVVVTRADRALYVVEGGTRRRLTVTLLAPRSSRSTARVDRSTTPRSTSCPRDPRSRSSKGPPARRSWSWAAAVWPPRGLGLPHGVDQIRRRQPARRSAARRGRRRSSPRRATMAAEWVGPARRRARARCPARHHPRRRHGRRGSRSVDPCPPGCSSRRSRSPLASATPSPRRSSTSSTKVRRSRSSRDVEDCRSWSSAAAVSPSPGCRCPTRSSAAALDGLPEGPELDVPAAVQPRRANAAGAWLSALAGPAPDHRPELVDSADGAAARPRRRPVPTGPLRFAARRARRAVRSPATGDRGRAGSVAGGPTGRGPRGGQWSAVRGHRRGPDTDPEPADAQPGAVQRARRAARRPTARHHRAAAGPPWRPPRRPGSGRSSRTLPVS